MKRLRFWHLILSVFALAIPTLGCGLTDSFINKAVGGDNDMTAVSSLWSDVPPMDGMVASQQVEMPAFLKALARPIMDTMMKGLNDGQSAGHWDWTAFTLSDKTPADVQAFYTPDRMTPLGWQQADAACLPMSDQGVLCSFTKDEAGKSTGLIIIAAADDQKKETSVFFLRAEGLEGTPVPGQSAQSFDSSSLVPIAPITISQDLTQIDLCQAIPKQDIEALLGRQLVKAPEFFNYYDTPGSSGCSYEAEKDSDGQAHFAYVALTPVEVYDQQPLYLNVDVTGIGDEAYFNNGADARQLWVKINNKVAFVVANGDVENEEGEKAIANLMVAAIQ